MRTGFDGQLIGRDGPIRCFAETYPLPVGPDEVEETWIFDRVFLVNAPSLIAVIASLRVLDVRQR
jgi:hypothetical protein